MPNINETKQKAEALARNIWLAGLGSYGKNYTLAVNGLEKSQSLFDVFVARGEKVESEAKSKLSETQEKILKAVESLNAKKEEVLKKSTSSLGDKIKIDEIKSRVEELRTKVSDNIGISKFNAEEASAQLKEKIETISKEINEKVSKLYKS